MIVDNFYCQTFTHALFHLATNPQYIECLRHEIDHIVADEGWTKTSLDKMWELDSFLKESTRLDGILACEFCRLSHLYLNLSHTLQQ